MHFIFLNIKLANKENFVFNIEKLFYFQDNAELANTCIKNFFTKNLDRITLEFWSIPSKGSSE
jgi:hypothetical protein